MTGKPTASVSVDLDNQWSYLKTHGDPAWQSYPSYLALAVPRILEFLDAAGLRVTFFLVGQDAGRDEHAEPLAAIAAAGHEIGNHSHRHEPWLHRYSEPEVRDELARAEEAIEAATGHRPVGFRGPGYSLSAATLRTLADRGYCYDATTLPTFIGPLARAYYLRRSALNAEQRAERSALFGSWRDGLRPIAPYRWDLGDSQLVEVPVTTMPFLRVPIHFSYLLFLGARSPALARRYFAAALRLCRWRGAAPSLLLHPLDFLDRGDVPSLSFFPGTEIPHQVKLERVAEHLHAMGERFTIGPVLAHAQAAARDSELAVRSPGGWPA